MDGLTKDRREERREKKISHERVEILWTDNENESIKEIFEGFGFGGPSTKMVSQFLVCVCVCVCVCVSEGY